MVIRKSDNVLLRADDSSSKHFTEEENRLFKALSRNQSESIWGYAIREVCKDVRHNGNLPRFRKLIESLKSQANDNSQLMELIIGSEAVRMIKEL